MVEWKKHKSLDSMGVGFSFEEATRSLCILRISFPELQFSSLQNEENTTTYFTELLIGCMRKITFQLWSVTHIDVLKIVFISLLFVPKLMYTSLYERLKICKRQYFYYAFDKYGLSNQWSFITQMQFN